MLHQLDFTYNKTIIHCLIVCLVCVSCVCELVVLFGVFFVFCFLFVFVCFCAVSCVGRYESEMDIQNGTVIINLKATHYSLLSCSKGGHGCGSGGCLALYVKQERRKEQKRKRGKEEEENSKIIVRNRWKESIDNNDLGSLLSLFNGSLGTRKGQLVLVLACSRCSSSTTQSVHERRWRFVGHWVYQKWSNDCPSYRERWELNRSSVACSGLG